MEGAALKPNSHISKEPGHIETYILWFFFLFFSHRQKSREKCWVSKLLEDNNNNYFFKNKIIKKKDWRERSTWYGRVITGWVSRDCSATATTMAVVSDVYLPLWRLSMGGSRTLCQQTACLTTGEKKSPQKTNNRREKKIASSDSVNKSWQ